MDNEPPQALNWKAPIAVGEERLGCRYCCWSCPARYVNQSDKPGQEPRDGHTRLMAHVDADHYEEHRKQKKRDREKARYERRKAQKGE